MKQGSWYWVSIKGEWFPAMHDKSACGGWTNTDTWEDFDHEVDSWQIISGLTKRAPDARKRGAKKVSSKSKKVVKPARG